MVMGLAASLGQAKQLPALRLNKAMLVGASPLKVADKPARFSLGGENEKTRVRCLRSLANQ